VDAVLAANGRGTPPTMPPAARVLVDELLLTRPEDVDRWRTAGADQPALVLPPGRPPAELERTLRAFADSL
jgi:hypothetical protein